MSKGMKLIYKMKYRINLYAQSEYIYVVARVILAVWLLITLGILTLMRYMRNGNRLGIHMHLLLKKILKGMLLFLVRHVKYQID